MELLTQSALFSQLSAQSRDRTENLHLYYETLVRAEFYLILFFTFSPPYTRLISGPT